MDTKLLTQPHVRRLAFFLLLGSTIAIAAALAPAAAASAPPSVQEGSSTEVTDDFDVHHAPTGASVTSHDGLKSERLRIETDRSDAAFAFYEDGADDDRVLEIADRRPIGLSVDLSAPNETVPGATVQYDADVTAPDAVDTYRWEFDDGENTTTEDPSVEHAYASPGTYDVEVTAEAADGTASANATVDVVDEYDLGDELEVVTRPTTVVAGAPVELDVLGSTASANARDVDGFEWRFGDDGNATTDGTIVSHTFAEPGEYTVTVVADDPYIHGVATTNVTVGEPIVVTGRLELPSGAPAANDTVGARIGDSLQQAETDRDGTFELLLPERNGSYDLEYYWGPENVFELPDDEIFPHDGVADAAAIETVEGSNDTDLGLRTVPEGHLVDATVVDGDGEPERSTVIFRPQRNGASTQLWTTAENGTVVLSDSSRSGVELGGRVDVELWGSSPESEFRTVASLNVTGPRQLHIVTDRPNETVVVAPIVETPAEAAVDESVGFDASGASARRGGDDTAFDAIK